MPSDANGNYSLPGGYLATAGTTILPSEHNPPLEDVAAGLTARLMRSGAGGMTGPLKLDDGTLPAPSLTFNSDPTSGFYKTVGGFAVVVGGVKLFEFKSGALLPVGLGPLPWSGLTAPSLWVFARGQTLLRASYSDLWTFAQAEITAGNTLYTNGDASTTFTVPDLSGGTTFGFDNSTGRLTTANSGVNGAVLGAVGGTPDPTILTANLPPYTPSGTVSGTAANTTSGLNVSSGGTIVDSSAGSSPASAPKAITATFTGAAQGGLSTPIKTQPRSVVTNYIIYAGA